MFVYTNFIFGWMSYDLQNYMKKDQALGKPQKKSFFSGPTTKAFKKSLVVGLLPPLPVLVVGPLKKRTFFAASLMDINLIA